MFGCPRNRDATATKIAASLLAAFAIHTQAFAGDKDMTVLAEASSGPLRCEIRKTQAEGSGSVELTGIITGSRAIAGKFRFVAKKSGPGGRSNIVQANTFDLAASQAIQIAHMVISLEQGAHVTIDLTAGSDGAECHTTATL